MEVPVDTWLNADRGGDLVPAWLVHHGYALASIDYRLSDGATFPAPVEDCAAALRWLGSRADDYGFDADRVGLWGISAGGHLAAMLGTAAGQFEPPEAAAPPLRAVCVYCGPTDLAAMEPLRGREAYDWTLALIAGLLGGPVETRPALAKQASPVSRVANGNPPFLLVYGERDPLVPTDQGRALHDALLRHGVSSEFIVIPNGEHVFISTETDALTERFFRRHIG
jgi:acetyl esterase/lipase